MFASIVFLARTKLLMLKLEFSLDIVHKLSKARPFTPHMTERDRRITVFDDWQLKVNAYSGMNWAE